MLNRIAFALLLVFAGAVLIPMYARADEQPQAKMFIARFPGGNWLRLYTQPCAVATGWLKMQRAEWFYKGKNYEACWVLKRDRDVTLVIVHDAEPNSSAYDAEMFEEDVGV